MPEIPELHLSSVYINSACKQLRFHSIQKSLFSKSADVNFDCDDFKVHAKSRGKELLLILEPCQECTTVSILPKHLLFHFGMSGKFILAASLDDDMQQPMVNLPKHSHLIFWDKIKTKALCFVDVRRFGNWIESDVFSPDRGPDPVFEHEKFRENILSNLEASVFDKPICEVMLDQRYFNGIGNYLRSEILYRCRISPFRNSRVVLLTPDECNDLLTACQNVPMEVIEIGSTTYLEEKRRGDAPSLFEQWLQCYMQPGMSKAKDSKGRTVWFKRSNNLTTAATARCGRASEEVDISSDGQDSSVDADHPVTKTMRLTRSSKK